MKTLVLALRNLMRNRRRSLTTLLAMTIGACAVLLFGGYSTNINYGLQTDYVQRSGHLQIQHKDYFLYGNGNPAAYGIERYQQVIRAVRSDPVLAPMLKVVTPTMQLGGIAGNFAAGVSRTVQGVGVVVDDQNQMRKWNDYGFDMERAPLGLTGTGIDAAVIGTGVARVLQLCGPLKVGNCVQADQPKQVEGDATPADIAQLSALEAPLAKAGLDARIELLAANAHGAPNVAALRVVKAEDQGIKELDDIYVALHLEQAQRLVYGNDTPRATAVVVQLQHTSQMPVAKARLQHLMDTSFNGKFLDILEFATLNPFYGQATNMFGAIFGFISLLIGAIVLFTVGNTMSMAVVERTVEIGTLRAMGLRHAGIRRLFVCEGVLLGTIGAVIGVSVALVAAYAINHSGLTWTPPGRVEPLPLELSLWGETNMIIGTGIGLMLVATLSAWLPAHRASRLNIVDALRHV
jgi:putative ABC transport system permease protein